MKPTRRMAAAAVAAAVWTLWTLAAVGQATLTITFEAMDPHIGQAFALRVVERPSGREVARFAIPEIAATTFDLEVADLALGASYRIDFYADLSGNGRYDAPPIDHAWRLEVADIQGDTTLSFAHTTEFIDIAWPPAFDGMIGENEYAARMIDPETAMAVHWQHDGSMLYVGLEAPGTGWLSIGFEPERRMQGANIVIASIDDGVLTIEDHYGHTQTSHRRDDVDHVVQAAGSESDGRSTVEFAIPLDSEDDQDKALEPGTEVVIILAYHRSNDGLTARHSERSTTTIRLEN